MSEALRLAHELILAMKDTDAEHWDTLEEAAAELRRLHAALAEPERKPLSEDEIIEIVRALWNATPARTTPIDVAREIERAHGIGEQHE